MTISFEQIKFQHLALLELLFSGQVKDLDSGIKTLSKKMNDFQGFDTDLKKLAYLKEVKIFWNDYYQELCQDKSMEKDEVYRKFRQTGERLQGSACYDLAVDLLAVATNGLGISKMAIHHDIFSWMERSRQ